MQYYPWQQSNWDIIFSAYQQQRLPHALLLTGPQGMGKVHFGRCLAQFLFCQQTKNSQPCSNCHACRLFQAGNHPDFMEITLSGESRQIKIEQIRVLSEDLNQTSHAGGYQIVLLHPANQLNRAAANALLKTLEEPNGKTLLILVADQLGALPATILSRCQKLVFQCADQRAALSWLQNQLPNNSQAALLLQLADHAPLYAKELANNAYLDLRNQLLNSLQSISEPRSNPLAKAAEFLQQETQLFLYAFISLVLDILRLDCQVPSQKLANYDCESQLRKLHQTMQPALMAKLLETLMECQRLLLSQANPNWQLNIEQLFLQWQESRAL